RRRKGCGVAARRYDGALLLRERSHSMPEPGDPQPPRLPIGTLISHSSYGRGRVVHYQDDGYVVLFKNGESHWVGDRSDGLTPLEAAGDAQLDRLKQAVREVLLDYGWLDSDIEMGKRWLGGTMRLVPGQEGVQAK